MGIVTPTTRIKNSSLSSDDMQAAPAECECVWAAAAVVKMMMKERKKKKKIVKKERKRKQFHTNVRRVPQLRLNAEKQKAHYSYANQESRFRTQKPNPAQPKPNQTKPRRSDPSIERVVSMMLWRRAQLIIHL